MPSAGECIAGRYRLECPLGEGGMGSVWRARHVELDAPIAVKFQHAHRAGSKGAAARFRREARAAARLRNPHVVRVVDFGVDAGLPYLAMELLEGESLKARLAQKLAPSVEEALEFVHQAASALDAAHRAGIIHRDLKPSNLFVVKDGKREIVKLLDFGIAKWFEGEHALEATATEENLVVGSATYMSPEQSRGETVDRRSDVWSLGVVAYEMLAGATPFSGANIPDTLRRICAGNFLPLSRALGPAYAAFDPVFARAFELDPDLRYRSAGELSDALSAAGSALATDVRRSTRTPSTDGWAFGREAATLSASAAPTRRARGRLLRRGPLSWLVAGVVVAALGVRVLSVYLGGPRPAASIVPQPLTGAAAATVTASAPALPSPQSPADAVRPSEASTTPAPEPKKPRRPPVASAKAAPSPAAPSAASRLDPVFGLEVPVQR